VGTTTFRKGLDCLRPRGMMVLFGPASGAAEPIDPQTLRKKGSLYLPRPSLADHIASLEELEQRATDLFEWIESGELMVRIYRTFPLGRHRRLTGTLRTGRRKGNCC
jgi:NADPH2:quinone reductase